MNPIKKGLHRFFRLLAVWIIVVYAGVSFVQWDINPALWDKEARGIVFIVGLCIGCFLAMVVAIGWDTAESEGPIDLKK